MVHKLNQMVKEEEYKCEAMFYVNVIQGFVDQRNYIYASP